DPLAGLFVQFVWRGRPRAAQVKSGVGANQYRRGPQKPHRHAPCARICWIGSASALKFRHTCRHLLVGECLIARPSTALSHSQPIRAEIDCQTALGDSYGGTGGLGTKCDAEEGYMRTIFGVPIILVACVGVVAFAGRAGRAEPAASQPTAG